MDKILIIVQARMESTRFPGKVLQPILGQPMLLWQLERVSRVGGNVVVASPMTEANHAIRDLCRRHGYDWMAVGGDQNDVLNRYFIVAYEYEAAHIVRLTGDCPLIDPSVIELCIDEYFQGELRHSVHGYDHVGVGYGWADGQDCEIFSMEALTHAHTMASSASDREHVTPFMYRTSEPGRFSCTTVPCPFDLSWQQYSVDTPKDLQDVETILQTCLARYGHHFFGWREIWRSIDLLFHVKERMLGRVRNRAYVKQVAAETGSDIDWNTLRYGREF